MKGFIFYYTHDHHITIMLKTVLNKDCTMNKGVYISIDENWTLKATEYDNYENIAGLVWLSLFMGSNGDVNFCPHSYNFLVYRVVPIWNHFIFYIGEWFISLK
jgi:hypothetical protein